MEDVKTSPDHGATQSSKKGGKTNTSMKNAKKKAGRIKAKLLNAYYGNPIKDMKLICITGSTGKTEVAHYIHEILGESGQHVAVLASDESIKVGTLHKFLSDAWKAGANYVVVTAPAESLKKDVFYGLPVHVAALTDYIPSKLDDMSAEEFESAESTLFTMNPDIVILNRDDAHFDKFKNFTGTKTTVTYGSDKSSDIHIESSKLYKKGTEANINIAGTRFTVASFQTGEPTVSYMAAAVAIANALHIAPDPIIDGIANYEADAPQDEEPETTSEEDQPEL